jgi:small subunit ribosomal protein S17
MADEEKKNEEQASEAENAEETPAAETPAEEPVAEEAPAEEPAAEEEPAPAEEAPAAEEEPAPAEEAPAAQEEPAATEEAPAEEPAAEEAPAEALHPKELRRRARSQHRGEALPQRSVDERAEARADRRRKKAEVRRKWRQKARERRRAKPSSEPPAPVEHATGRPRVRQGVVVSDRANKTITVEIDIARPHRMYGKIVRTTSTLHAHDESNDAHVGDKVRVVETQPMSKTKRWRLVEVLERAR